MKYGENFVKLFFFFLAAGKLNTFKLNNRDTIKRLMLD